MYVCKYECMYVCRYVCMQVCVYTYIYVCKYINVHTYIYHMHVCICVYIGGCFCLLVLGSVTYTPQCMLHIYKRTYIHIYIIFKYIYLYMYTYMCISVYTNIYVYMYIYIYIYIHIYVYVCVCVCVCVYICIASLHHAHARPLPLQRVGNHVTVVSALVGKRFSACPLRALSLGQNVAELVSQPHEAFVVWEAYVPTADQGLEGVHLCRVASQVRRCRWIAAHHPRSWRCPPPSAPGSSCSCTETCVAVGERLCLQLPGRAGLGDGGVFGSH
jgi:hypothetical protein